MLRVLNRTSNSKLLLLIFLYTYSEVIHTFFLIWKFTSLKMQHVFLRWKFAEIKKNV